MTNVLRLDDIDRVLDSLESAAKTETSNQDFWRLALDSICLLLDARAAYLCFPFGDDWKLAAKSNSDHQKTAAISDWLHIVQRDPSLIGSDKVQGKWASLKLNSESNADGVLVVEINRDAEFWRKSRPLVDAIVEIGLGRIQRNATKVAMEQIDSIDRALSRLSKASTLHACNTEMVDNISNAFAIGRVSLVQVNPVAKLLAISSTPHFDPTSAIVREIEQFALESISMSQSALDTEEPGSNEWQGCVPEADAPSTSAVPGKKKHRMTVPWKKSARDGSPSLLLVLEWDTREHMLEYFPHLPRYLSSLYKVWYQQQCWLNIPVWLRSYGYQTRSKSISTNTRNFVKFALLAGALLLGSWVMFSSRPMKIKGIATLEPVSSKSLYAAMDGHLSSIMVKDNDRVSEGQLIAVMRSPTLEIQLEEAVGKLRAMAEKRNGLRVSMNQLDPNATDSSLEQGRIAAELLILDAQERHAKQTLDFLRAEQQKLHIRTPISGVVVAKDINRELENRPLRRGDLLFSIVEPEGDWRLKVEIEDKDSRYVSTHTTPGKTQIEVIFDSLPSRTFKSTINRLSLSSENLRGTGNYQIGFGSVEKEVSQTLYMGAKGTAYFECGKQPLWYIWSRPLVEYLQKRHFLFQWTQRNERIA